MDVIIQTSPNINLELDKQPNLELSMVTHVAQIYRVEADSELSLTSTNAVQNKVVAAELKKVSDSLTTLTADAHTEGSVDNKIRRAVSWGKIEEL